MSALNSTIFPSLIPIAPGVFNLVSEQNTLPALIIRSYVFIFINFTNLI